MDSSKSNKRARRSAFKRRRFYGNRFTIENAEHSDNSQVQQDTSNVDKDIPAHSHGSSFQHIDNDVSSFLTPNRQKIALESSSDEKADSDEDDYFLLAHFWCSEGFLDEFLKYPDCGSKVEIPHIVFSRMGFANKFMIKCQSCARESQRYMSNQWRVREETFMK